MSDLEITEKDLASYHGDDPKLSRDLVRFRLAQALESPKGILRFMHRHTYWNGYFGCGVASLAGKIGRSRGLFTDADETFAATADRSVLVASYFFDAARDEFDDHETPERDPHRCLAQATLKGTAHWCAGELAMQPEAIQAPPLPHWLRALGDKVATGYGAGSRDDATSAFRAMGYHLGSEVLADNEFSVIDELLREKAPELVAYLDRTNIRIADQSHNAYTWIRIHSGGGGAVEADHFDWATKGVRIALHYTQPEERHALREQALLGYNDFVHDHREFFQRVNLT